MAKSIAEKLRIKPNNILLTINAPVNFKKGLTGLTSEIKITSTGKNYNQIHWFVMNKQQLEKEVKKIMTLVRPGIIVWIYYPKGTSRIQTDLSRDKGWDSLKPWKEKLTWINLISFDDTWSVFGFRPKTEADKKKEAKPVVREIFNWVDPTTKEVKLPDDLVIQLKKNKDAIAYFNSLSFTNKKEYIEWIVTAKRPETRQERIDGTIDRLKKKWKNPRNI